MKKRVMCFGTFNNLHAGHLAYFNQARLLGEELIVVVGRQKNVHGTRFIAASGALQCAGTRVNAVKKLDIVDKAVLGDKNDKFKVLDKYKPDIVCLGYDQEVDLKELRKRYKGRIVRLKPYQPTVYKSSLKSWDKPVEFTAKRIKGFGQGQKLGFPTINLNNLNPGLDYGVYLVEAKIDSKIYKGLLHFGPRKSFQNNISCELYIREKIKVNKVIKVRIVRLVRKVREFKNIKSLISRIKKDVKLLKTI